MSLEANKGGRIPTIIWPSVVTPDDISAINHLRAQGQSLGASVAWTIINEARQISRDKEEDDNTIPNSLEEMIAHSMRKLRRTGLTVDYALSAAMVLEAEQAVKGGDSILDNICAGFWGGTVNYRNIQEIHPGLAVREVEMELTRQHYANILRQEGPLSVVDRYCAEETPAVIRETISKEEYEASMLAAEKGRQRFHQLYKETL